MMSMNRQLMILITCLLVSVAVYADDGLPIVEVRPIGPFSIRNAWN